MTEKPDLEKILETILAVAEGLDKNSAEKIKQIAQKISAEKDYHQLKMLERAVLGMFERLYTQCPQPKVPSKNYFIDDNLIKIDDDFEISYQANFFNDYIKITYSGIKVFDKSISGDTWKYLREQVIFKIITNDFDKIKFLEKLGRSLLIFGER